MATARQHIIASTNDIYHKNFNVKLNTVPCDGTVVVNSVKTALVLTFFFCIEEGPRPFDECIDKKPALLTDGLTNKGPLNNSKQGPNSFQSLGNKNLITNLEISSLIIQ